MLNSGESLGTTARTNSLLSLGCSRRQSEKLKSHESADKARSLHEGVRAFKSQTRGVTGGEESSEDAEGGGRGRPTHNSTII